MNTASDWEQRAQFYEKDAAAAWEKCEERRLEAAALLAALKALCDHDASYHGNEIHIVCDDHGDALKRMRLAREAIAKAEGGS